MSVCAYVLSIPHKLDTANAVQKILFLYKKHPPSFILQNKRTQICVRKELSQKKWEITMYKYSLKVLKALIPGWFFPSAHWGSKSESPCTSVCVCWVFFLPLLLFR